MCEFWHCTAASPSKHAHGSVRLPEQWVHCAPPVLSKNSSHASHSTAFRSDEVLQPVWSRLMHRWLVFPLHWVDSEHDVAPAAECWPAGHELQVEAPDTGEY